MTQRETHPEPAPGGLHPKHLRQNRCGRRGYYAKPSQEFEPYLKTYLQSIAYNTQREFRDEASICLQNVKATIRCGGRRKLPNSMEVKALIQGKFKKIKDEQGDWQYVKVTKSEQMAKERTRSAKGTRSY